VNRSGASTACLCTRGDSPHLRALGDGVNRKLLEVERLSRHRVVAQEALDRLQQPSVEAGQRVSALRFGAPASWPSSKRQRACPLCRAASAIATCARRSQFYAATRAPPPR
jgi:hypothetical protein